jgi:hypothetical protein
LGIVPPSLFQPDGKLRCCITVLLYYKSGSFRRRIFGDGRAQRAHRRVQESLAVLFRPAQVRFQFVAKRHSTIDGGDDAFLFLERWHSNYQIRERISSVHELLLKFFGR